MSNTQSSNAPPRRIDVGGREPDDSPWSPLRRAVFRAVWTAAIASNIGTWIQSVGAAWLMTSLTPSPLLVALMQTATSLPVFLLGLPAGALADVVDRRKLLLVTESWMLLVALALGVLTLAGLISAWTLLALTFLLGVGAALDAPAWQAIIPELVERHELPSAVALHATGFNVAWAIGSRPRQTFGHVEVRDPAWRRPSRADGNA
jgi:MFS family permease